MTNVLETETRGRYLPFNYLQKQAKKEHFRNEDAYEYRSRVHTGKSNAHKQLVSVSDDGSIDFKRFTSEENFKHAFDSVLRHGGPAPGIDRVALAAMSRKDVYQGLRVARDAIRNGTYRPREARNAPIPKPDGTDRIIKIETWVDRTISKALDLALKPFWNTRLPFFPHDVPKILRQLAMAVNQGKHFVYLSDIKACYDNVPTRDVITVQHEFLTDANLQYLIQTVALGSDGLSRQRGVNQGNAYSPVLVEAYLHQRLDIPIMSRHKDVTYLRYVDDLLIAAGSEQVCRNAQLACFELLEGHRLKLQGSPEQVIDLRDDKPIPTYLGFHISEREGKLLFEVPQEKVEQLRNDLSKATGEPNPPEVIKQKVSGFFTGCFNIPVRQTEEIIEQIKRHLVSLEYREINWRQIRNSIVKAQNEWEEALKRL